MNHSYDVLVIGGGIVGLCAALAMGQRNYRVAIIAESDLHLEEMPKQDVRVFAINQASCELLKQIEVWQFLDPKRIAPYTNMWVQDAPSKACIEFKAQDLAASNLGYIIEESVLKQALLQQISTKSSIHVFPHAKVEAIEQTTEQITLLGSEKNQWQGRFLMVADGANSPMRQHLEIGLDTWSYNQKAIVAQVSTTRSHQKTAYQIFNPEGPLAFLPLVSETNCSIVWSTDDNHSQKLMSLDEQAFNQELNKVFAHQLGEIRLCSPRYHFPLRMRHVKRYAGSNWIILGDAAHTIHPLAGLGLNLGLADVSSWIKSLDNAKNHQLSIKHLMSWQRERKHAVWQTILLMEGFKHLFGHSSWPLKTLRGWGLTVCNELLPLKRLFIQHAVGKEL